MARPGGESLVAQVARTLDAGPDMLGIVPELLSGLDHLGADPARVLPLLRAAGIDLACDALDLGCGKGALAIALAGRGARVRGIDGLAAFIGKARDRASAAGVTERCDFRVGDARGATRSGEAFDLVTLVSVGPLWGNVARTVEALGSLTRDRGVFAFEGDWSPRGGGDLPTLEGLTSAVGAPGGTILAVDTPTLDEVRAANAHDMEAIQRAASRLRAPQPSLRPMIDRYVQSQSLACREAESGEVRFSTFLVRPAPRRG